MKTWRLVSGILCCVLGAYVFYQVRNLSLYLALTNTKDNGVSGGTWVAGLLIAAGIISIVCRSGGKGGNICLVILFPLAAFCAFYSRFAALAPLFRCMIAA